MKDKLFILFSWILIVAFGLLFWATVIGWLV